VPIFVTVEKTKLESIYGSFFLSLIIHENLLNRYTFDIELRAHSPQTAA
jgi:hypothetical protein